MLQESPLHPVCSAKSWLRLLLASLLLQAGCARYQPLPLNDQPRWPSSFAHISVNRASMPFRELASHRFDPSDGLDMTEVAMLAVANNPDLRLARDDAGIGRAQAFAAGLLPDPQLSMSRDLPASSVPGLVSAYSISPGYDLQSLLLHGSGHEAAEASSRQIDLNLLWQEWQVVSQARVLFSRAISQDELLGWLQQNQRMLHTQYVRIEAAAEAGNVTADLANASLVAWQDISRQVNDLQRQQLQTRHEMNTLLGLAPGTELPLRDSESLTMPDRQAIDQALAELPQRRPDLLALQAGYHAQDARYRQAILAQFPPLNLAYALARDTGGVVTHGLAIAMAVPLLNGNRGQIAVSKATRQRLHDEYENRVLAARAMVHSLLADSGLISAQLATVRAGLPQLDAVAKSARQRLEHGDMDEAGFVPIETARINKHIEAIKLQQSLLQDRIALLTLLGLDSAGAHP
jgi:outer membrane protein, heavy metal efflux system